MTDTSHSFSYEPLKQSVQSLVEAIADPQALAGGALNIDTLEKLARTISAQLKTITSLQEAEAEEQRRKDASHYTRFEDLKRPPPEERERMVKELNRHFGITDEA